MSRDIRACRRSAQRGQAMTEYVLVALVLVLALFTTDTLFDGKTGAQYLADLIRAFFRSLTYFLSLP